MKRVQLIAGFQHYFNILPVHHTNPANNGISKLQLEI